MAFEMIRLGFTNVAALKGGFREWVLHQWPIEEKGEEFKNDCVGCHLEVTPAAVQDWKLSKHAQNEVTCAVCHGDLHKSSFDLDATLVQPDRCAGCHEAQAKQFANGKHSKAWEAVKIMPSFHHIPANVQEDTEACAGCHRIGSKTREDVRHPAGRPGYGNVACNACHTRHTFFKKEAAQPEACRSCHTGPTHAQWEMYSSSKHGVRSGLKQLGVLPEEASAPTCQSCHMPGGDHGVKTPLGSLGISLPVLADKSWSDATFLLLRSLGVVDRDRNAGPRFEAAKRLDMLRFTYDDWLKERVKLLRICNSCHSQRFGEVEFDKGYKMLREADLRVGEAIGIVAGLYRSGLIKKPKGQEQPFPDLFRLNQTATPVEQRLWLMTMEHRRNVFHGAFHSSPGFALRSGLDQVEQDLSAIRQMADDLKRRGRRGR